MDDPTRSPAEHDTKEADAVLRRTRRRLLRAALIALAAVVAVITALILA